MRRTLLPPIAAAVLLTTCSRTAAPIGAASPRDAENLTPAAAAEEAGARAAVISFLEGYATAPRDDGDALGAAVAPSGLMRRWAYWVDVQNEQFPGSIRGELVVRAIGAAEETGPGAADLPDVTVDADAVFHLAPDDGDPFDLIRTFSGVRVVHLRSQRGWVVTDAVRDGVPLSASLVAFDLPLPSVTSGGVRITLDSVTTYPSWQFQLFGMGGATQGGTLRRAQLVDAEGTTVADAGTVTAPISSIPAHEWVQGIVTFEPQRSLEGLLLQLVYRVGRTDRTFEFDLDDLIAGVGRTGSAAA